MTYRTVRLNAAGTALVLGVPDDGLPHVLHWGADLPDDTGLAAAASPPAAHNGIDVPTWMSLAPTQGEGWRGHPGIAGHHEGRVTFPAWTVRSVTVDPPGTARGARSPSSPGPRGWSCAAS
jgi:alpha-galactosidase